MMPLFWVVLCSVLPLLALCSDPDRCTPHESISQNASPVLESLQCHNDYQSYVHCSWREGTHTPLELWVWNHGSNSASRCLPYGPPVRDADDHSTVQCRYESQVFAIGISHTFFFKTRELTSCSSAPDKPLALSQHLSVHPPMKLSHVAERGGQLLRWSSPYPTSSSLNKHLTYQLSYRREREDNWTTENLTHIHLKLEALLPGCRYEARVRARGKLGQWSDWTPLVTWQTAEVTGQVPSLQCVLEGEKEVTCSWEVKRELAHFITYQLTCRHNQTAPSERCCVNSTVGAGRRETMLRYSCSLTAPDPAHLLLELIPTRSAKTFNAFQHIRPNRPREVRVKEKEGNWAVRWNEPNKSSNLRLYYQVRYCNTQDQETPNLTTIPEGSMSLTILSTSLAPSQTYQVWVRSLVVPGNGPRYEGIPSEWSEPVEWASHAVYWSLSTFLYIFISAIVAIGFFMLYYSIPACKRKVVLWVESVPSPGKSKVLSEFKSANSWFLLQNENTCICIVQNLKSLPTCSSEAVSLWPTKNTENKGLRRCTPSSSAEKVTSSESSAISFSGPYILCQDTSGPSQESVDLQHEDKKEDPLPGGSAPLSPERLNLPISGSRQGYVCLPNHSRSRSIDEQCDSIRTRGRHDSRENQDANIKLCSDKPDILPGLSSSSTGGDPPAYTPDTFTPWPQGDTLHSGYCRLP